MPTTKTLGQSYPSAATATTLYTATSGTIVSTLNVCNIGGAADYIRVAVRPAGATLASQHYTVYGLQLPPASFLPITIGITLANTDVLTIYSTTGTTAFSAFGQEGV